MTLETILPLLESDDPATVRQGLELIVQDLAVVVAGGEHHQGAQAAAGFGRRARMPSIRKGSPVTAESVRAERRT